MAVYNEDKEQIALFTWIRLHQSRYPLLAHAYHTPNGGHRDVRTAAKFKAMGVKRGVWDVFIPAPAPGLWVEMKYGKGKLTVEQSAWRECLSIYGYRFEVAYDWIQAARYIGAFVGMPEGDLPR